MASKVQFKRSSVEGKVPLITDLDLGELAINTFDGKVYLKKNDGTDTIVDITAATSVDVVVRNETGSTVPAGTVIYLSGASGNKALLALAQANSESTSTGTYAVTKQSIANNQNGLAVIVGQVAKLNTSAYTAGQVLWLSPTTAGAFTTTKPVAPNHAVYVAIVTRSSTTQGTIEVKIQNGYELDELHNVLITTAADGEVLAYEASTGLWKNKPAVSGAVSSFNTRTGAITLTSGDVTTALGFTPYNATNPSGYISGNQNITFSGDATGSGATSVSLTLANSGVTAGTFNNSATAITPFTVDAKGRVTGTGAAVTITPAWASITSKPTTISGFGITDAYTKTEVDGFLQGLDPKSSVRAATTTNITLTGTQTIDGVAVVAGDRVLVKDQTTASQNGIYVVASGAWTRSTDLNIWAEFPGAYVFVEEGTTNQDFGFVCTNNQTGTLETTSVTWVQFNGAANITAGTGLAKSGNTLSIANTAVTPNTYGSGSQIPIFTVNQQGQITNAGFTSVAITSSQVSGLAASATTDTTNAGNISTGILSAARMPAFTGDATSSQGTSLLTLANSGVTAGTYRSVTVDAKGRVTGGTNPTTLSGYGITDAQPLDSDLTAIAALAPTLDNFIVGNGTTWILETPAQARASLGGTTAGQNLFTVTNPSAVTFLRINADNTVSTLDAATFRTAIGAGTSSTTGTVTSVSGTGTVSGLTLTGTVTGSGSLTLGGAITGFLPISGGTVTGTLLTTPGGQSLDTLADGTIGFMDPSHTTGWSTTQGIGARTGDVTWAIGSNGSTTGASVYFGIGSISGGTFTTALSFTQARAATFASNVNVSGALTQSNNQVLHAGNYSSYALPLSGGTMTGVLTVVSGGTAINISGQSDSFGYNSTSGLGTYIKGTAGTYIYGGGSFYDGSAHRVLIHAGNYTSYSPTLTGGSASGTWGINITGNAATATTADQIDSWGFRNTGSNSAVAADSLDSNGITYVATNISLVGQTDGALYSQFYSSSWQHQIYGDYRTGQIVTRGKNSGTWQAWRVQLDASNYTSYAPSLTGSGASGTWGINITGTANNITAYTINQSLGTSSGPTFAEVYSNGWFRTYNQNGLYNQTHGNHWYATSDAYWNIAANNASNVGILFRTSGHQGTVRGYVYADSSNNIGFLNSSGSWRLRVVGDDYSLADGSSMRAQLFYDSNDTNYYVNPNSTSLIYALNVYGGGLYDTQTGFRLPLPGGGAYATTTSSVSGAIKVRIPTAALGSNTMGGFDVQVYTYDGLSFTIRCGGYNYSDASKTWYNVFAYMISGARPGLTVRFGWDGTSQCVWIGELGSSWSYPQVAVTNFVGGYSNYSAATWATGWTVSFETSSFYSVSQTATVYPLPYSTNNTSNLYAATLYDANNTAYYVDPASTSVIASAEWNGALTFTGTSGNQALNLASYNGYASMRVIRNNAASGTNDGMYIGYGNSNSGVTRIFGGGATSGDLVKYAGYTEEPGSFRAPIFYDSNNTGYYVDPNSTSNLYDLQTARYVVVGGNFSNNPYNSVSSTRLMFGGADSNAQENYYIGTNLENYGGNYTKLDLRWHTGIRLGAQQQYGGVRIFDSEDLGSVLFSVGKGDGNTRVEVGSFYSNLMYDRDNTGYYIDPASTSVLNRISTVRTDNWLYIDNNYGHSVVGVYSSYRYQGVWSMGSSYLLAADGSTTGNLYGIAWSHPNAGGAAANLASHGMLILENGGFQGAWGGGRLVTTSDIRGTIFYDYNNTGYYCDPNSTSYLYGLTLAGGSYFRPQSWIQLDGSYGLYWPNHYSAHLHANDLSTYTQIALRGGKNSYGGIYDQYSGVNGIMYDSAGNGGVYREANGRWYLYYSLGNDCMGIGTSTTSSTYSLYLNKGVYAGSRIDATIFYDANDTTYYVDPTGTTSLRTYGDWRATDIAWTGEYAGKMQYHSSNWYIQFTSNVLFRNSGGTNVLTCDSSGNLTANGNVTAYSDIRLKENIYTIDGALSKVLNLRGVYYNKIGETQRKIGLVAQEAQQVIPEVVISVETVDPATGTTSDLLAVDYGNTVALLIEAVKEQQQTIQQQASRIEKLEKLLQQLI